MIVATAGHVDHGKTSVIRALTSVDTDRLPEEKKRGMTIDLGFAYLAVDDQPMYERPIDPIGFVDVPGHERFLHNLLCGLAGIDLAMLVVAADDGVMPQTIEHLRILDLLGVSQGIAVLTRIDRADCARIDAVRRQLGALCADTTLGEVPFFPVCPPDGRGIDALKRHLLSAARNCIAHPVKGNFRFPIDRAFTIDGTGFIVTGMVATGSAQVGDRLYGPDDALFRLRSLRVHGRPATVARAGQRCALNLAGSGSAVALPGRGDWLRAPGAPLPSARCDVLLKAPESIQESTTGARRIQVYLGTSRVNGSVVRLEPEQNDAACPVLAQLVLEHPIHAAHGDRFVIRDPSLQHTIAGGTVLDIFAPARGRRKPERLLRLRALAETDDAAALVRLLDVCAEGVPLERFCANRNLREEEARDLFATTAMRRIDTGEGAFGFSPSRWTELERHVLDSVGRWHRESPRTIGMPEDRILAGSAIRGPRSLVQSIAAELARENRLVRHAGTVRLPGHQPARDPALDALWHRMAPHVREYRRLRPPSLAELAALLKEDPARIEAALEQAARLGTVVRISAKRYYTPGALRELGKIVCSIADEDYRREVSPTAFRDRSGIGRNVSIEVLEYFDRLRFTRRSGNVRQVVRLLDEALAP